MEIYAIGNLTLDLILRSLEDMPPWGIEIAVENLAYGVAGNLGNFSFAARTIGIKPIIIGNIGNDANGKIVLRELKKIGLDTSLIKLEEDKKTSLTVAFVRKDGERTFITYSGQLNNIDNCFLQKCLDKIKPNSIVILCSLFQLPNLKLVDVINFYKELKNRKCKTLLDTGWDLNGWKKTTIENIKELLRFVDIFLPNYNEAKMISGYNDINDIIRYLKNIGLKDLVIKMGKNGSISSINNKIIRTDSFPSNAIDTTGAGDTFNAAFVYGIINNLPPEEILRIANAAASFLVSKSDHNERFPTLKDINKVMQK